MITTAVVLLPLSVVNRKILKFIKLCARLRCISPQSFRTCLA